MSMKKMTIAFVVLTLLASLLPFTASAQEPVQCELEYTVQDGDWLGKIAEGYYGDLEDYVRILEANNAQSGDTYTDIADPNVIEPGWVLCIPSVEDLMTVLIEAAEDEIEAPRGLSPEQLANATYASQYTASGEVTLENGLYSEPAAPGSASEIKVRVTRHLAYGELNGTPSAAIVLLSDPGGSGSFYDLHVMVSRLGRPVNVASILLGDRVQIKFIAIADNLIHVNMITQGPDDPFCCPTQEVVQTYALEGGELKLVYTNLVSGLEITPSQIRLDTQGLPYAWQANVVAEQPYTTDLPPGPTGLPEHMQINFGVTDPADRQPGAPVIYIIPADKYRLLWEEEDNNAVSQTMDDIFATTVALPEPPPTDGLPVLPFEEIYGVNDVAVQLSRVVANENNASQNGYRFVGRFAQSPNPITSDGLPLYYIYQGFTNDGQYMVSFFYPVTSAALPTNAEVSEAFEETLSNNETETFIEEQAGALNTLSSTDFEPNLNTLDALVASLEIDGMVSSGLHGQMWGLIGRVESNGDQTPLTAIDSQNYTIVYNPDGTLNFQADCNSGSNGYTAEGGMVGQVAVQPGPLTLAECGPGSLSDEMIATVTAAAGDYKVHPGGNVLELIKPAGGGSLLFGTLGPVEAPPPEAQIRFWADDEVIKAGECTTLHWEVENVQAVWVYPQGQPYENYPMTGKESHQVCPETSTTYEMRVLLTDGNVELRQVTVNVEAVELPPAEISFSADQTVINQGECTNLRWQTANVKGVWVYPQGQPWDQYPVEGVGSQEVCPENTTTYEMRTQLPDDQIDLRQLTIQVQVEEEDPLQNTAWLVAILNSQPPLPDTELTLNFGGDGTANGNAGCNTFNTPYSVSGSRIAIGPISSTGKLCDEAIDAQERAYLSALQAAGSFSLEGNQLIIRDNAGLEILRLDRVEAVPL